MRKFVFSLLLLFVLVGSASALGVVSDYNLNRPLEISPGEKKVVGFRIQNIAGERDLNIRIALVSGEEIAKLNEKEVIVPAGAVKEIFIDVTAPKKVEQGNSYTISLSFSEIEENREGINLGIGLDYSIAVLVLGESVKETSYHFIAISLIIFILLIAVIILVVLIIRERKRRNFESSLQIGVQ